MRITRHTLIVLVAAPLVAIGAIAFGQVMVGQGGAKLDASLQVGSNGYNRPGGNAHGFQQRRYTPQQRHAAGTAASSANIRQQQFHYSPSRYGSSDPTIEERNRVMGRAEGPRLAQSGRELDSNLQLGSAGYFNSQNSAVALGQQRYQPNNSRMRTQAVQNEMMTYQAYTDHYSPRRQSSSEQRSTGHTSNRAPSNRAR